MNYQKYGRGYFDPPAAQANWMQRTWLEHAPIWCSVDLRDGNQALVTPMSVSEKLAFFNLLVQIGFREIEVGFPAASDTEFQFVRRLIDEKLIPAGVTIQVLTPAREHIIRRTFEAIAGAERAIVHMYNPTSAVQREQVFHKSKAEIKKIAVDGAMLLKELADGARGDYRLEYSPESFTATEPEYALEVIDAVLDVWRPSPEKKAIINLPATVALSLPHVYAGQVEYISTHMTYRDGVTLSLHPHNDRGCAVADTELGLLAGAERVEGTLFGNGERTGNVDIVTLAMNLFSHGVDPKLDFSHMPEVCSLYERVTRMPVYERQPYAGKLVFAAFSGAHQDAIAKGMKWREGHEDDRWSVPYLPIDPHDVGREYETDVIRINSQSGKGGVAYVLEQNFGLDLPAQMREAVGYLVKSISDHAHRELSPEEVLDAFKKAYVNGEKTYKLDDYHFTRHAGSISVVLTVEHAGCLRTVSASGNGRLDAVSNALKKQFGLQYTIATYKEHALERGSSSRAVSYVGLDTADQRRVWGVGVDEDIVAASIKGLFSAVNRI